jgi:hypothetical protein
LVNAFDFADKGRNVVGHNGLSLFSSTKTKRFSQTKTPRCLKQCGVFWSYNNLRSGGRVVGALLS